MRAAADDDRSRNSNMAEPHEQAEAGTSPPPEAINPGEGPPALRYFSAEMPPAEESYRALSLLALAGFGLGAVYALSLIVLALVSFFARKPLFLSGLSFLVPVLAVVLCVLASVRIRRSEGTLAGASLVHWGLVLSLLVGLGYGAYRAGMYFAIKQQAQRFTERWLELLREGDMARAGLGLVP